MIKLFVHDSQETFWLNAWRDKTLRIYKCLNSSQVLELWTTLTTALYLSSEFPALKSCSWIVRRPFAIPSCFCLFCEGTTWRFEKAGPEKNWTRCVFASSNKINISSQRLEKLQLLSLHLEEATINQCSQI
jgi:hypothetical protein